MLDFYYDFRSLNNASCTAFLYHFRLNDRESFKQPAKLLSSDFPCFLFISGPPESAVFQSFIQKHKTITFPVQGLHHSCVSAAKQKQGIRKRIQPEILLYYRSQAINLFSHVCVAHRYIDMVSLGNIT